MSGAHSINSALQHELLTMLSDNEAAITALLGGDLPLLLQDRRLAEIIAEVRRINERSAARFQAIINEHGWPGTSLVGGAGTQAAFFIVTYLFTMPEFQRAMVPVLRQAVTAGEAPGLHLARLEDGIRCMEGRPQKYGAALGWDENGEMTPFRSVEDPEDVDRLRAEIGLPSLRDAILRQEHALEKHKRRVPREELAMFETWARVCGWREP